MRHSCCQLIHPQHEEVLPGDEALMQLARELQETAAADEMDGTQ